MTQASRETVDLSPYPDLVMVLLGFRANRLRAIPTLFSLGRGFAEIRRNPPNGLLGEEGCLFGWNHIGFRQYWRDMEALEQFTRTAPHSGWWQRFAKDQGGAGFWHEVYSARGGMEAIYLGLPSRIGFARFAPVVPPTGPLMGLRGRVAADRAARGIFSP